MKNCSKCNTIKNAGDFNKRKKAKDGLRCQCRSCENEYKRKNKEKIKKTSASYYLKNKNKLNEKGKEWRDKKKEYIKEKAVQYRLDNKVSRRKYLESNKKHVADVTKAYREKNKKKAKEYAKQYLKDNKDKLLKYKKKYYLNKKCEHIEQLKKIIDPNIDDQWLYIMECGVYHKIGISEDPLKRVKEIERSTNAPTRISYIASAYHGRTVDAERIIHHELSSLNIPMPYMSGETKISREWFFGSIEKIVEVVSQYADLRPM